MDELPKVPKESLEVSTTRILSLTERVREYNQRIGKPYTPTDLKELRALEKLERLGKISYDNGYWAPNK